MAQEYNDKTKEIVIKWGNCSLFESFAKNLQTLPEVNLLGQKYPKFIIEKI